MKLTIGIPNYNWWELLRETILSSKNIWLSTSDYEILIIDNCSTDNSKQIVSDLFSEIPNIRFIENKENCGRIGNWNNVFSFAKGEYVLFLMIWDLFILRDVDSWVQFHDENPNTVVCFDYEYMNDSHVTHVNHFVKTHNSAISTTSVIRNSLETLSLNFSLPILQNYLFRKNIIAQNRLFFEDKNPYLADLEFITTYVSFFEKILFSDSSIIKWRAHSNRFTFHKIIEQFNEFMIVYPRLFKLFLHRDIKISKFKVYILTHLLFLFVNKVRHQLMGTKVNLSLWAIYGFYLRYINNVFFWLLAILFFPLYCGYILLNVTIFKFKYPLKF